MAENGKKLFMFVGSLLGSFLGVVVVIYNLVYAPLNNALATETIKRESGDECIKVNVEAKLDKIQTDIVDLKIMLAKLVK